MKTMIFVGLLATLVVVITTTIGFDLIATAAAQMTSDNATMAGNVTGGNMTDTNSTESGNISSVGGEI